jgi:hypothetical protein
MRTQHSPLDENPALPSELSSHQEGRVGFSATGESWILIRRGVLGSHQEGRVGFSSRGERWIPLLMRTQLSPLDENPTFPS